MKLRCVVSKEHLTSDSEELMPWHNLSWFIVTGSLLFEALVMLRFWGWGVLVPWISIQLNFDFNQETR